MSQKVGTGAKETVKGEDGHSIIEIDNMEDRQKEYTALLDVENGKVATM